MHKNGDNRREPRTVKTVNCNVNDDVSDDGNTSTKQKMSASNFWRRNLTKHKRLVGRGVTTIYFACLDDFNWHRFVFTLEYFLIAKIIDREFFIRNDPFGSRSVQWYLQNNWTALDPDLSNFEMIGSCANKPSNTKKRWKNRLGKSSFVILSLSLRGRRRPLDNFYANIRVWELFERRRRRHHTILCNAYQKWFVDAACRTEHCVFYRSFFTLFLSHTHCFEMKPKRRRKVRVRKWNEMKSDFLCCFDCIRNVRF